MTMLKERLKTIVATVDDRLGISDTLGPIL